MSAETGPIPLPDSIVKPFMAEPKTIEHLVAEPVKYRTLYNPVEYVGATSREEGAPYDFRINEPLFAEYLRREFGFGIEDFKKLRVYVIGEHPPKKPYQLTKEQRTFFFDPDPDAGSDPKKDWAIIGEDEDGTQHIIFYASNFWRDLNKERASILRFAKTKKRTEKSWDILDSKTELLEKQKQHPKLGRRFTEFLAKVVPDDIYQLHVIARQKKGLKPDKIPLSKAISIIDRFLYNRRAKNAIKDHVAIHETSHSFQYKVSWDKLTRKVKKLARKVTYEIVQLFMETTAESDEIRMAKKPELFGMIDFRVDLPPKARKAKSSQAA